MDNLGLLGNLCSAVVLVGPLLAGVIWAGRRASHDESDK